MNPAFGKDSSSTFLFSQALLNYLFEQFKCQKLRTDPENKITFLFENVSICRESYPYCAVNWANNKYMQSLTRLERVSGLVIDTGIQGLAWKTFFDDAS